MDLHDPTNGTSEPTRFWSTANIGEAMPDVLSPMCWSFWGPNMEAGARLAYYDFGILSKSELAVPGDPNELLTSYFYGRPALNLDRLRSMFNCIPGMSADDFERDICGEVRPGLPTEAGNGRTVHVIARGPVGMATAGRGVRRCALDQRAWWEREVHDGAGARHPRLLLTESAARFREAFRVHVRGRFVLMSLQAQLTKLAEGAGRPDLVVRLLAGFGGVAETEVADDLWQVGRGTLPLADFVRRHGFHGPLEGNVAGTAWREDTAGIRALATAMAARPDDQRPRRRRCRGGAGPLPYPTRGRPAPPCGPGADRWPRRRRRQPWSTSTLSRRNPSSSSREAMMAMARRTAAIAVEKDSPRAAASMSVLDGTHPVKVQSPPMGPSWTSSGRAPARAAARAAAMPPGPPPTTMRSRSRSIQRAAAGPRLWATMRW